MKRESRTVDRSDQVDSPTQRHLPLVDLLVDMRAELMEFAIASGLKVLHTMLEEDRTAMCGPRYQRPGSYYAAWKMVDDKRNKCLPRCRPLFVSVDVLDE